MAGQAQGKRILFMDDDEDFTSALSHVLRQAGYIVRWAQDGEQGVRMAEEEPPDLIILDYMMPLKSGFEACRELRQMPRLRDVPILALTAFGRNIGETHGPSGQQAAAHVRDCLEKPVEPNVLLERVAQALSPERLSSH